MKLLHILFLIFSFLYLPLHALELTQEEKDWLKEHKVIKTAVDPAYAPYAFFDDNGKHSGISADFVHKIESLLNIKMQVVPNLTWEQILDAAKNKEIDVITTASYRKEREEYLAFSQGYIPTPLVIMTKTSNTTIQKREDIKGKTIALVAKYSSSKKVLEEYKDAFTPYFVKTPLEGLAAVSAGQADGYVGVLGINIHQSIEHGISNLKVATYYDLRSNYQHYGVRKDFAIFAKILDKTLNSISQEEKNKIFHKWVPVKNKQDIQERIKLNKDEQLYLDRIKSVRMCVDPNWLPFEKIDAKGNYIGMGSDYMSLLSKKLGYELTLVKTTQWSESLQKAEQKECDIIPLAMKTKEREKFLNFTRPYLSFPLVIATHKDELYIDKLENILDKKLAIVKGYAYVDILKKRYKNIQLIEVNSVKEGLLKVNKSEVYGFIDTIASIVYEIQTNKFINLKVSGQTGDNWELSVAVRDDSKELLSVFEKLIDTISDEERRIIESKWISIRFEHGFDYAILWKVLFVVVVIIGIFILWNRKLSKEIQERLKAQEELQQSQKRLELALKGGDLGSWDVNFKTHQLVVNERWATMLGYNKKDIENTTYETWLGTIHPQDRQRVLQEGSQYKNGEIPTYEIEYRALKQDGTVIWLLSKGSIVEKDAQGQPIRMVGTVSDITLKKNYETQLMIAKEKAESATQAKSMFLAKMSHEIRTPMNAILGMLYLTQNTKLTPVQDNYVAKAKNSADSLLRIINDILDFSKIEAGKLDIENIEFDFHELISKITSIMSFKAEEQGIELLVQYDDTIPQYLISDPTRIEQILLNLISNAIKFTSKGEVILYPKITAKNGNDLILEFCIKDSGIGISIEHQEKLFKDFSQVDESTTRKFGGTGLGLAISKKLSNLLGGDLKLKSSTPENGSVFCFNIKCKKAQITKKTTETFPESLKDIQTLIVDDNHVASEILSNMLDSLKIKNESVHSGEDAIALISKASKKYDIIFMDYKMPGLSGIETYEILHKQFRKDTPRTIMVTAYSKGEIIDEISKVGIDTFLTKPVHPSLLFDSILEVLGKEELMKNQVKKSITQNIQLDTIQGAKILLVEDNKINQEFATILLESNGFEVDIANDGLESLSMIKSQRYDVVLMDIQMPNMDGLDATQHIRAISEPYYQNIPIIGLSAHAMKGDIEKSLSVGMNEHITKPIDPEKLFETLLRFIEPKEQTPIKESKRDNEDLFYNLSSEIINFEEGIQRAAGNQSAYLKILSIVLNNYENYFEEIEKLVESNEFKKAEEKVHEIKGVSGNIAANALFEQCVIVDELLKDQKLPSKIQMQNLKTAMLSMIQEIRQLNLKEEAIENKLFDKQEVIVLLNSIDTNLELNLVQAQEELCKLASYLQHQEYQPFYNELSKRIEAFETDEASFMIKEFISSLHD